LLLELPARVPPEGVAEAVPHLERRERRDGTRQRRPEDARVLVAHVQRLAVRVGDRIVVPGRQAVLPAVPAPACDAAGLAYPAAEALIRDQVDPRHGRPLAIEADDVLAAVRREAPVAVVEEERRLLAPLGLGLGTGGAERARRPPA